MSSLPDDVRRLLLDLRLAAARTGDDTEFLAALDRVVPPGDLRREIGWLSLHARSNDLIMQYGRTEDEALLREFLALREEVVILVPTGDLPTALGNYADGLRRQRDWANRHGRHDLHEAANDRMIEVAEAAVAAAPESAPERLYYQAQIASALRTRAESSDRLGDLDRAVATLDDALRSAHPGHPERAVVLNVLGNCLRDRYEVSGDVADLDRAVEAQQETNRLDPGHSAYQRSLGHTYAARAAHTGRPDDRDAAIEWLDRALERGPVAAGDGAATANSLGGLRFNRYAETGLITDLQWAIHRFEQAVEVGHRDEPNWPWYRRNLALALEHQYEFTGDLDELERARQLHEEALRALPEDSPARPSFLEMLARCYLNRSGDISDLDQAISLFEQALRAGGADADRRNLAQALLDRGSRSGDAADLDRAVTLSAEALAAEQGTTNAVLALATHARAFAARYDHRGLASDREAAETYFRRAYDEAMPNAPSGALDAATSHGWWALSRHDWPTAADAYARALAAAQQLASAQVSAHAHLLRLDQLGRLPGRAAYALARLGRLDEALLTLEQGRATLLSNSLARDHADLAGLRAAAGDDLADRYLAAAGQVRAIELPLASGDGTLTERDAHQAQQAGAQARARLAAVLEEIRQVPGFERFLLPPAEPDLRLDELDEPVVFLVATEIGGLALICEPRGGTPRVEWLPQLLTTEVDDQARTYLAAYQNRRSDLPAWRDEIVRVTGWLWDAAMGPLLTGAELPERRLRLVPTGALSLLPLHAAWRERPDGTREYACDLALVTYAPNLRFAHARRPAGLGERLLAVGAPAGTSAPPLPHAGSELDAACAAFPDHRRLESAEATPERVLSGLREHSVIHLACHGSANLTQPLRSGVLLSGDRWLTLQEILDTGLALGQTRLAVISACETALSGTWLLEEAITLPSALLRAGAQGAIGSLWAVPDLATTMLMKCFYEAWPHRQADPAQALSTAATWVRDSTNAEKLERFPDLLRETHDRLPGLAREIWLAGKPHAHPYFWAAFAMTGS